MALTFEYELDPLEIEKQSFEIIKQLCNFTALDDDMKQIAMRLVHTTGDVNVIDSLKFSTHSIEKALFSIQSKSNVLCDVEMVKQGLTKRLLKQPAYCFLNHVETPDIAKKLGQTRSMAALNFWPEYMENSIVLIANAPTALFRLLEMIDQGAPKPALIIALPVGFIGAEESKKALWEHHRTLDIECITLLGRQGGSALTAAVLNALMRIQVGIYF